MYKKIYDFENLYNSYLKASKLKRYRKEVLAFSYNLEENLIILQNELIWKTYRVGTYRQFKVYEPKERIISALPFRDRIIQHALCSVIEPVFEKQMIYDSYACRTGKGTLAAANRLSYFLGKPVNNLYLKCDISKYFKSIDLTILKKIVVRQIEDPDTIWLINLILDSANVSGLPIGNLMSQLFANLYLGELDFFLKTKVGVKYYLRYMDDFIILHNSKQYLKTTLALVDDYLDKQLHLQLNAKTTINNVANGIDFVGFKVFRKNKLIKKNSMTRMSKKVKAWQHGKIPDTRFVRMLGSWVGHATGTASYRFVTKVLLSVLELSLKTKNNSIANN